MTESGTVIDNPGFAPYVGKEKTNSIQGYALVNGFFVKQNSPDHHAGVDFFGCRKGNTPIKSLVSGTVAAWHEFNDTRDSSEESLLKSFGNWVLIRDGKDLTKYYILAHMSTEKVVKYSNDMAVYPGLVIGYVGNTGHCKSNGCNIEGTENMKMRKEGAGTHLHVQVFHSGKVGSHYSPTDVFNVNSDSVNPFHITERY